MDNSSRQEDIVRSDGGGFRRWRLLEPLAERNFRLLWLGEGVSVFGNHFEALALTWVILDVLKAPGLALGTVMMASAIPRAVLMLFGGVVSDRVSPRLVMLVSNASLCVLVVVLAVLVFAHVVELWQLYIFAVIFGVVGAFFLPAMMTMIPRLLDRERLEAGNALIMGTMELSGLVGPAAAGVVVAVAGTAVALGVDAATFAFAVVMVWLITAVNARPTTDGQGVLAEPRRSPSALTDIKNGFRYAWRQPAIRAQLPAIAIVNLCVAGPVVVGLPVLVYGLTGEATSLGIVMAAAGGGGLFGTLLAGSIRLRRRGILLITIFITAGATLGLLSLAPNVLSMALLVGIAALGSGLANVMLITWFQGVTRPDMLGRVMSLIMFASAGLQPVSFALAGLLVDLNPTLMFAGAGGLIVVAGLYLAATRAVRTID